MIEANEDITLIADRQLHDVEQAQAQAKAIAEGREIHPALLAQQQTVSDLDSPQPVETAAQTIQPEPARPPADPDATFRHVRLGIMAIIVLILLILWLHQRKG